MGGSRSQGSQDLSHSGAGVCRTCGLHKDRNTLSYVVVPFGGVFWRLVDTSATGPECFYACESAALCLSASPAPALRVKMLRDGARCWTSARMRWRTWELAWSFLWLAYSVPCALPRGAASRHPPDESAGGACKLPLCIRIDHRQRGRVDVENCRICSLIRTACERFRMRSARYHVTTSVCAVEILVGIMAKVCLLPHLRGLSLSQNLLKMLPKASHVLADC